MPYSLKTIYPFNISTRSCHGGWLPVISLWRNSFIKLELRGDSEGTIFIAGMTEEFCEDKRGIDSGRVFVFLAELKDDSIFGVVDSSNASVLVQSVSLACIPTHDFWRINITMDSGTVRSIEPLELHNDFSEQSKTIVQVHPWNIARALFNLYKIGFSVDIMDLSPPPGPNMDDRYNVTLLEEDICVDTVNNPASDMLLFSQDVFWDNVFLFNHLAIQTAIT